MDLGALRTILFALITIWVFGREFSDHTAKELMALPTSRWIIVAAKFVLIGIWTLGITLLMFVAGLGVGAAVDIPGWSLELGRASVLIVLATALLTFALVPFVALFASSGRGYLPPLGWTILSLVSADIVGLLGYGIGSRGPCPCCLAGWCPPPCRPGRAPQSSCCDIGFLGRSRSNLRVVAKRGSNALTCGHLSTPSSRAHCCRMPRRGVPIACLL